MPHPMPRFNIRRHQCIFLQIRNKTLDSPIGTLAQAKCDGSIHQPRYPTLVAFCATGWASRPSPKAKGAARRLPHWVLLSVDCYVPPLRSLAPSRQVLFLLRSKAVNLDSHGL